MKWCDNVYLRILHKGRQNERDITVLSFIIYHCCISVLCRIHFKQKFVEEQNVTQDYNQCLKTRFV